MVNKRKDSIKEIEQSVSILEKMFKENSLNDLLYYRAIIKLAFDCVQHDFADKAMVLLLKVPRSYYVDHIEEDMNQSDEFYEKCAELAKKLKIAGYDVAPIKINMFSAKA